MIALRDQNIWIRKIQWCIAGTTLLGLAGYFLCIFRPLSGYEADYRARTAQIESQLRKNEEAARDLPRIKRDVVRLRDQITRSRQLPLQQELPKFLRDITRLSQASRLQKFRYEPDAQRRRELCSELPITLMFDGQFMDVASFLRQAEEMPRMMRTRRLTLRGRDTGRGVVEVQLSMSIFFADGQ